MIETIIKRNGVEEEFQPSKLNGWGEWAARTLGTYVDWNSIVLQTVSTLPKKVTSKFLQERLIQTCLEMDTWSYNRMAGRLYAALRIKELYGDEIPTVKEVHDRLYKAGLMVKLDYSDEEYAKIEKIIKHDLDYKATHFEINQLRHKYALQNRSTKKEYESQQFVYMRMAMALAEDEPKGERLKHVRSWYEHFAHKRINAPTPNFVNLGTKLRGYASCCVFTTNDTAPSIEAGSHIAYVMTCQSAGIGAHMQVRSLADPVRNGAIEHQGKLPYYRYIMDASKANLQAGRGGAVTMHNNCFDPEIEVLNALKNPMSVEDRRIRGMDYSFTSNKFFARKAARNEDVFLFNAFTAPDLYQAMYEGDETKFAELYEKYEKNTRFKKTYVSAREILIQVLNEANETGRAYETHASEMNRHTPFIDKIYSSNLCQEIALPTAGYEDVQGLYSTQDHGKGEIGLCSLGGIVVPNIESDEMYEDVMYYTLKMIDKCIHISDYPFPHLGFTAKARMSAGIGIIGLAHYLARKKLSYSSQEGKDEVHRLAEKHMFFAIKASLRLGKELGNAPWIHKTKWPQGWLPIDTYNKSVDGVVTVGNERDWEGLRKEIIENGGIRNSVLIAHMPSESSSISAGTTNGLYPVRSLTLIKGDNNNRSYWAAPEGERLGKYYDIAYDVEHNDLADVYAIIQKFTDQAISADFYTKVLGDTKINSSDMLSQYFYRVKMGLKTKYYTNARTTEGVSLDSSEDDADCETCTL